VLGEPLHARKTFAARVCSQLLARSIHPHRDASSRSQTPSDRHRGVSSATAASSKQPTAKPLNSDIKSSTCSNICTCCAAASELSSTEPSFASWIRKAGPRHMAALPITAVATIKLLNSERSASLTCGKASRKRRRSRSVPPHA
jgi:hypothetical protein